MRPFSFLRWLIEVLVETWGVYMEQARPDSWNGRIYAFLRRHRRFMPLGAALLISLLEWASPRPLDGFAKTLLAVLWLAGFYYYGKVRSQEDDGWH